MDALSQALAAFGAGGGFALRLYSEGGPCADSRLIAEDCALELGAALREALGDSVEGARSEVDRRIEEALARVRLAFEGGPDAILRGDFGTGRIGGLPAELLPVFYHSLANALGARIRVDVSGGATRHAVTACSRGVGVAIREACRP
jgi:imidazoleglycerol phosphate dehydratase HisB